MSCKLDAGSSNLYSFTGQNLYSTLIYLGKHYCSIKFDKVQLKSHESLVYSLLFLVKKGESWTNLGELQEPLFSIYR